MSLAVPNALNAGKQALVSMTFFFLPVMLFGMGLSGLQIGILMSVLTVVIFLSSFPIGVINDRLSIRYVMMLGMFLESAFFFGLSFARGFPELLLVFIVGGLGGNMVDTSIRSLVFKKAEDSVRGRKLGFYQFVSSAGSGAGTLLGGTLLWLLSFNGALIISAGAFLVMGIASLLVADTVREKFPLRQYGRVILRKTSVLFFLPLFILGLHWGAENTSYAMFLRSSLGLDLFLSGIYMGIPIILLGVVSLSAGRLIDTKGSARKTFILGFFLSGAGHILMTVNNVPLSFAFRLVHEVGDGLAMVSYLVIFAKMFKKESIAGETGAASAVILFGSALGAIVFGQVGYALGFAWPLIISGALTIASVAIILIAGKRISF
ncbi:MAG: MFS transporter [Candidatus Aenigmatarchaeota archaeon]